MCQWTEGQAASEGEQLWFGNPCNASSNTSRRSSFAIKGRSNAAANSRATSSGDPRRGERGTEDGCVELIGRFADEDEVVHLRDPLFVMAVVEPEQVRFAVAARDRGVEGVAGNADLA